MIAEAGLAALWFAAAMALLQFALAALGLRMRQDELSAAVRPVAMVQGALAALSFALLIALFLRSDMSVLLVAQNSHSAKPLIYKFAGAWGNHEGSMLLWVTVLALAGAAIALLERKLDRATLTATLGAQAFIALGFYIYMLLASSPFTRLDPAAADGMGLNPLLQDPGLAFHPPTLYFGYVGLSIAFSFAVGAMVTRQVGPAFARAMRPWVLAAWIFLTLGITAGSYWAYYELGWGGWWFWDPSENASLMPWLAATALLHSVNVLAARDGLRAWTLMLAVTAFSMSMLGTFLIRSGLITSVHAFAVDPTRGSFILALMGVYVGGALALFALRVGKVKAGEGFDLVSREGGLVLNNLLLTVLLGIVVIGTFYPLVAEAMGQRLSVGPPFFNKTAGPVALILVAAMAAGPVLRWRRDDPRALLTRLMAPIVAVAMVVVGVLVMAPDTGWMEVAGLGLAAGLAIASFAPVWRRNVLRTPMFTWGMVVAHFGVAVSLAGMAADSAFTVERLVAARYGETYQVGPWRAALRGVAPVRGDNWSAVEGRVIARRVGHDRPILLRPQRRYYSSPPTDTAEAALVTQLDGQLYAVLGGQDAQGRWQLRLWWKPFVTLIWFGGALIALGGALALLGRLLRERRGARRREAAA